MRFRVGGRAWCLCSVCLEACNGFRRIVDFGGAAPPGRPLCLRLCWCCLVKKKNSKVSKQVAPPWSVGWWCCGVALNISEARRGGAAFACLSSSSEECVHLESVCQGLRSKAPPQVLATVCFFNSDGLQIRGRAAPPGRPAPQGFQQIGRSLLTRRQRVCLWRRPSRLGESSSVAWVQ